MKRNNTNKVSSRMRLHRRAKTTITLLAAILACGAVTAATNTRVNDAPYSNEVMEETVCQSSTVTTASTTHTTSVITTVVSTSTVTTSLESVTSTAASTSSQSTTLTSTITTEETSSTIEETQTNVATDEYYEAEPEPEYCEPVYEETAYSRSITDAEYVWLCNLLGHEYGSNWVPIQEKAKVIAVVMNRVNSPLFPNDIYSVITQPYQFTGFSSYGTGGYTYQVTQSVKDAVDYYFSHTDEYQNWLYFDGGHYAADGSGPYNYFYF